MTQPRYIFIGGVHRTGTSLLRNTLNRAENVAICNETYFLGSPRVYTMFWQNILSSAASDLTRYKKSSFWKVSASLGAYQKLNRMGDLGDDQDARKIVDYIYDHGQALDRAFWSQWLPEHVTQEAFLDKFFASDRTDRALFQVLMDLYAGDKPIRGEKTPAHIYYLPTLMAWFPEAKFIHIIRDPRDIFLSQKTKKGKAEVVNPRLNILRRSNVIFEIHMGFGIITHWIRAIQLHHQYQVQYPHNYYMLRFEDLIADPEACLKPLCDFLEIDLAPTMLEAKVINSSFVSSNKISGFDKASTERWRKNIPPFINQWFVSWCKNDLLRFGYQIS